MRAAAEFSRDYALQRVAFGQPIAHHQALAFLIADMRDGRRGLRACSCTKRRWRLDRGDDAERGLRDARSSKPPSRPCS